MGDSRNLGYSSHKLATIILEYLGGILFGYE